MRRKRIIAFPVFTVCLLLVTSSGRLLNRAAAGSDTPPAVTRSVGPSFAGLSLAHDVQGRVSVQVAIDSAGDVVSAHTDGGPAQLRAVSEKAAAQWKFSPSSEPSRRLRLEFVYAEQFYFGYGIVRVEPYHLDLPIERPRSVNYVPEDWKPGTINCELHHVPLQRDEIEIGYGMVWPNSNYYEHIEVKPKYFPHARPDVEGGCIMSTDKQGKFVPRYAEVLYCPVCQKTEDQWFRDHPAKPWN